MSCASVVPYVKVLTGTTFHVQTDHKPLVSLLSGAKSLDALSPIIQHFRMRLMKYTFTIAHVQGKDLMIADTLPQLQLLLQAL